MKDLILFIDTSDRNQAKVVLRIDGREYSYIESTDTRRSQVVLPILKRALAEHRLSFSDLKKIYTSSGPGSFTGLRVGASIANALGSALRIPVNDKPPGSLIELVYE